MKKALITGITGQDGSYLTELLLEKNYEVHGIVRRASLFNRNRIEHLKDNPNLKLHYGDMTDSSNLNRILEKVQPDEIYNLAAQSHVGVSFEVPEYTAEVDAVGTLRFLDAINETGVKTKFYQASTSELYGLVQEVPQTEKTPFYPRSPYVQPREPLARRNLCYPQNYSRCSWNQSEENENSNSRKSRCKKRLGVCT